MSLSIYSDDTVHMIEMLKHGTLDIMFGISADFVPTLDYIRLTDDLIYFVASRRLLAERAGARPQDIEAWSSGCVPASAVAKVPVTMNTKQSTLAALVKRFFNEAYIAPEVALRTSNFHTHLELCRTHQVAAFLPTCMIPTVITHNALCADDEKLCVMRLPADDAKLTLRVDCVLPGGSLASGGDPLSALPAFKASFIKMLSDTCQDTRRLVHDYLAQFRRGQTGAIC